VRARSAATEFLKLKKNEARGFILNGDAYFQEKDWASALDNYLKAEKLLRAGQQREQVNLSIQLGKTYRRLPFAGTGVNPNLTLAIEKLEAGIAASPGSYELAGELGGAYLAARQDAKALATADRLIGGKEFATASTEDKVGVVLVSAKAQYNLGKLAVARQRFEAAVQLRPKDAQIQRALVETINAQAWAALTARTTAPPRASSTRPRRSIPSPMTALNHGGAGDRSRRLRRRPAPPGQARGQPPRLRDGLRAAAGAHLLCSKKPDKAKAAEHYARPKSRPRRTRPTWWSPRSTPSGRRSRSTPISTTRSRS
jgi:tetratricopeptide (TPR) repeat protein